MRHLIFIVLILLFLPISGWAAVLYLEPSSADYYSGDTFMAEVRINTENECVNTVSADLSFPKDILEAVDFSNGDSILTFWVYPPTIGQSAGLISFAGGIPGGYCGYLLGDPGESNLLGKMIFKVKEAGWRRFGEVKFLNTSQVLLNDGFGTSAELKTRGAEFTISPKPLNYAQGKNEWQDELAQDNIPPEIFKIEINQDPSIFEGKYFITFSTTDKQTGIDYYEVKEGKGDWLKTASPYVLGDQELRSIIEVRAVDKAGNHIIVTHLPTSKPFREKYFAIVLVLIIGGIVWFIIRRIRRKP